MKRIFTVLILPLILWASPVLSKTYYVSPSGNDNNTGTISSPFATLQKGHDVAASGDIIYLRGGTYKNFTIKGSDANYHYVNQITKSGISFLAYPGETPVFNFSNVAATLRIGAFQVTGANNVFQGFEITGVQVGTQKQSECFQVSNGNGNIFRQLKMHDGAGVGIYIIKSSANNRVENCDAFNLIGVSGTSAGNIDGFGCHSKGTGNIFTGCRAWNCSDDGYDCITAAAAVTFDRCWSYSNGVNGGDGNGFKSGGWGSSVPPSTVPAHTVRFCLAANNHSHGFYANHQPGKSASWYNNTSYNNNAGDFDMLERVSPTDATDMAGTREVLHNNLAFVGTLTKDLNESGSMVSNNSWTLSVSVSSADFLSIDATQMTKARLSDGSLPAITFMHLASGSDLIDKGVNVGFSFNGSAPDLGCFETGSSARINTDENIQQNLNVVASEQTLEITVFPNPSQTFFTLASKEVFEYTVYDMTGISMQNGVANESVEIGHTLQSGMYIINIKTAKGNKLVKILKK